MRTTVESLVTRVATHAATDPVIADFAVRTVLAGLGSHLTAAGRGIVVDELPPAFGGLVDETVEALPIEERLLAKAPTLGRAHELAASVCHALGETLSLEALEALHDALPAPLAAFLAIPDPEYSPPRGTRLRGMASGHFGSAHPIAEAHPERAQSQSVAAGNPHADTKLSSSPGSTQERLHETLAEAHPIKNST